MKRETSRQLTLTIVPLLLVLVSGAISPGAEQTSRSAAANPDVRLPELLPKVDFEADGIKGWALVAVGDARGQVDREVSGRAGATNSHSLRLTVLNPGLRCGVSYPCIAGFKVKAGSWYDLAFWARTEKRENDRGYGLTVSLESAEGGMVFARTTLPEVGGDWNHYAVALHAYGSGPKVRLVITMSEPGTIWLDDVSLTGRTNDGEPTR